MSGSRPGLLEQCDIPGLDVAAGGPQCVSTLASAYLGCRSPEQATTLGLSRDAFREGVGRLGWARANLPATGHNGLDGTFGGPSDWFTEVIQHGTRGRICPDAPWIWHHALNANVMRAAPPPGDSERCADQCRDWVRRNVCLRSHNQLRRRWPRAEGECSASQNHSQ